MDAKALGRDEVTIYKAMFEDYVLLRVKYYVSRSSVCLSILAMESIYTLICAFCKLAVSEVALSFAQKALDLA